MSAAAAGAWDPRRTWAFVVGTLEWAHPESFASFPQINRRDAALVDLLRERGVPLAQIVYLQDEKATTARIHTWLERHLAAAAEGDLLLLYYCGHGAKTDEGAVYFASYGADGADDPGWTVADIPEAIERHFRGSRALLLADCCHSGSLWRTRSAAAPAAWPTPASPHPWPANCPRATGPHRIAAGRAGRPGLGGR